MEANELLGLDVGKKRTGIARASSIAKIAEPLATIPTQNLINELKTIANKKPLSAIVVGLPRNLRGEDSSQTKWVRDFVAKLKEEFNTSFYWQDEALTSHLAEVTGLGSMKSVGLDALAASIILQDFIDSPEADRLRC